MLMAVAEAPIRTRPAGLTRTGESWAANALPIVLGVWAAFWLAAVSQWWIRDLVVPWDAKNHFYPMLRFLAQQIHSGEFPLWNPYHFAGHPTVADPQSLLFTPTLSFVALLSAEPTMRMFDLAILAHTLVGGAAVILLFRHRGWHPAGALLAALVYALGGAASARLQHVGMIVSYGLFPVAWVLLESALQRRSLWRGVLFGAVAALMALDRDQVAFMACLTLLAVVGAESWRSGHPLAYLRRRIGVLLVMAITGALVLVVPVTLTMQFLADSNRPEFDFAFAAMSSMHPTTLATLLVPNIFGNLRLAYDYWGPGPHTITGGPWNDPATAYLGIGTIPAALMLWHGVAGRRLAARDVRFFVVLFGAALVYALGRYTPLFHLAFEFMPGVDLYRRPADAMFVMNVALAVMSGYLLHRYIRDGAPGWRELVRTVPARLCSAGVALFVIFSLAAGLWFGVLSRRTGFVLGEMAFATALTALLVLVLGRASVSPAARFLAATLVVFAAGAELIGRNAGSALSGEPASRYAVFADLPPEQQKGLQVLRAEIAERQARGERPRVEILGLGGAWQNASMIFNLEDTVGYNALRIAEYEKAVGSGENAVDLKLRTFPGTFKSYKCSLAALLGLQYLVLDRPIEKLPTQFGMPAATLLYESGSMWIYKLTEAAPRAYFATRVRPVDTEETLEKGDLPAFDRENDVLIAEEDVESLKGAYGQDGDLSRTHVETNEVVRISKYRPNTVSIEVNTPSAGILVLHDPYYPGWKVFVNGEEKDLLRANLLFRGVELQPGRNHVEFRFEPLSVSNLVAAATSMLERVEN